MNAIPACDLGAEPTAVTDAPSTGSSHTQPGATSFVFGNVHDGAATTGSTLAGALAQPARPIKANAENVTKNILRMKYLLIKLTPDKFWQSIHAIEPTIHPYTKRFAISSISSTTTGR
jgi:hypothetical protein